MHPTETLRCSNSEEEPWRKHTLWKAIARAIKDWCLGWNSLYKTKNCQGGMGAAIMQACVWGGENQDESFRSSSFSYSVRWLCPAFGKPHSQPSKQCYLCHGSFHLCQTLGKKQGVKCFWAEFLIAEATPLRSCKEFSGWQQSWWPLTRCFTSLACEHAYKWEKWILGRAGVTS